MRPPARLRGGREGRGCHRRAAAAGLHADRVWRRPALRQHLLAQPAARGVLDLRLGHRDQDGYYFILGRTDDVINVAGHRLGTREIEESISSHPNVSEVAVVGVEDKLKGQVAIAFAIAKQADAIATPEGRRALEAEIMGVVDKQIGAVGRPARVFFVSGLPKTRSGKLLRRAIQSICEGRDPGDLPTIEDPAALEQVRAVIKG
jgi:propionyl-CoA synthetase